MNAAAAYEHRGSPGNEAQRRQRGQEHEAKGRGTPWAERGLHARPKGLLPHRSAGVAAGRYIGFVNGVNGVKSLFLTLSYRLITGAWP